MTVLVHNNSWKDETTARAAWPSRAAVRRGRWWNLWKARQLPYSLLREGSLIILLDSWPRGGTLSWLVQARNVHTDVLSDKKSAVRAIARWAGESRDWPLSDGYTADRPPDAGVVIYWQAEPVGRIDVPRPRQLALRRNGWFLTDERTLGSWGIRLPFRSTSVASRTTTRSEATLSPKGGRQGRRLDVDVRIAIEKRAMTVATGWCQRNGWRSVRDVSKGQSWDLEAVDGASVVRYVEVKGTTGGRGSVEVTKGEVDAAIRHGHAHCLIAVHDIVVSMQNGKPFASGGNVSTYDPWTPRETELVAQRFTWHPSRPEE